MAKKKQTKADKDFIKKISSITVGTGAKQSSPPCPGCGGPAQLVGVVGFPVYTHAVKEEVKRRESRPRKVADEDSFAA